MRPDLGSAFFLWPRRDTWSLSHRKTEDGSYFRDVSAKQLLPADFIEQLHVDDFAMYTDDDFRDFAKRYSTKHRDLLSWWASALSTRGIGVLAGDGGWYLSSGERALTRWRDAIALLDQDALAAAAFVESRNEAIALHNPSGATWMRPVHCDVLDALSNGLWDQHIHYTGTTSIPNLWLELVHRQDDRLERVDRYSQTAIETLTAQHRSERETEQTRIVEALRWRRLQGLQNCANKPRPTVCLEAASLRSDDTETLLSYERRANERIFLVNAWKKIRSFRDALSVTTTDADWIDSFDRYLLAKSKFMSGNIQFSGTPPGLVRFKARFFDAPKTFQTRKSRLFEPTFRVVQRDIATRLTHLFEEPAMRGVELRIAPLATALEYRRFTQRLDNVLVHEKTQTFRGDEQLHNVRLGVHFKRGKKIGTKDRDGGDVGASHHETRLTVAKESSTFAWHLADEHNLPQEKQHRYFTNIDVASMEAGTTPVDVFAPYLRLLTGCRSTINSVSADAIDSTYFGHWVRISHREEFTRWVEHAAKPRITYHAGEDFLHPLCGLRAISDAITYCNMKPGDRIGHGLALGVDVTAFNGGSGAILAMPKAWLLDDLVWLVRHVGTGSPWAERATKLAESLGYEIFHSRSITVDVLFELQKLRFEPHTEANLLRWRTSCAAAEQCLWSEIDDEAIDKRRCEPVELSGTSADFLLSSEFAALVVEAQQDLCERVRDAGIVIEANPTSNLAIGRHEQMKTHPYFRLGAGTFNRPDYTFNTDNPGVCGTSAMVEYMQMFEAMVETGDTRAQAVRQLARVRKKAEMTFFGQRRPTKA